MALTTSSSGTTAQTAGGGEVDIATINVIGKYRLKLDLDLMAAGDVVYISKYIIVKTGGASNLAGITMFSGVDGALPGGAKVVTFDEDWNDLAETDALQYTVNQPFGTTRALPFAVMLEREIGGLYVDGAVWIDTVNGAAGTVSYVNGTPQNPCSTLGSALTVAGAVGLRHLRLINGSAITLTGSYTAWRFSSHGYATIALGGQSLTNVQIDGCIVSGTCTTGLVSFENCSLLACTMPPNTAMEHCTFVGPITMGSAGDFYVFDSEAANIGGSPVTFDFGAGLGNSTLQLRKWTGTLSLANMGQSGTDSATVAGEGRLEIAASSQNSTVRIAGNLTVADSGTAMTFIEGGNYRNTAGVNTPAVLNPITAADVDLVWDDAVDGTVTARQSLRLANSANGAKLSGAATATVVVRDLADSKDRVTATVDADGNRTAVVRDLT